MSVIGELTTMVEAVRSPDKVKWIQAMQKEMESLYDNDVWDS